MYMFSTDATIIDLITSTHRQQHNVFFPNIFDPPLVESADTEPTDTAD